MADMNDQTATNENEHEPTAGRVLVRIVKTYPGKLSMTGGLVVAENALELLYPLTAGFAINAILEGSFANAMLMVTVIFGFWLIGAVREAVDSRVYAGIYADLAGEVIESERQNYVAATTTIVHTSLARQFVDFFEIQVPIFATAFVSIIGSVIMLLILQVEIGLIALVLLIVLSILARRFLRISECISEYLHTRQELEPATIIGGSNARIQRHFRVLAGRRVQLSDMEASAYVFVGVVAAALFSVLFWVASRKDGITGGEMYILMSYTWTFVLNLDEMPAHLQAFGKIRDLGRRVGTVPNFRATTQKESDRT